MAVYTPLGYKVITTITTTITTTTTNTNKIKSKWFI